MERAKPAQPAPRRASSSSAHNPSPFRPRASRSLRSLRRKGRKPSTNGRGRKMGRVFRHLRHGRVLHPVIHASLPTERGKRKKTGTATLSRSSPRKRGPRCASGARAVSPLPEGEGFEPCERSEPGEKGEGLLGEKNQLQSLPSPPITPHPSSLGASVADAPCDAKLGSLLPLGEAERWAYPAAHSVTGRPRT